MSLPALSQQARVLYEPLYVCPVVIGVRIEPELERRLDELARQLGMSRSACIREAIRQYLLRHGDDEEARRQSQRLADREPANWSEQVPDWSDWTA